MGTRMHVLQRELATANSEINRAESEAAWFSLRIKDLRSDLRRANRQARDYPVQSSAIAIAAISADLKAVEERFLALAGECMPAEAA
jgi:predicted  nucleic acid-binding Zn-ribbon protein